MTLTEVPDEIGSAAEILYIRLAREGGMNLVNLSDGGEGVTMTPEVREKIGAANRGSKNPCYGKIGSASPFFGQKHSEKTLAIMRNLKHGKKVSKETRALLRDANLGKRASEETRALMRKVQIGFSKPRPCPLRKLPNFSDGGGI